MKLSDYRIAPDSKVKLSDFDPNDDAGLSKARAAKMLKERIAELVELQVRLYASGTKALLVVLQAMDAAGKDSTIRCVFEPINPQGCTVTSFKAPSTLERSHDYLWRIHHTVPPRGMIGVFNRSHYEDVLIARVRGLVPAKVWRKRYDHINDFERLLSDEGVVIRKFFLHISKDYQRERLAMRLADPEKHWKFDPQDLAERELWDDYQQAYEEVLSRCSTPWAPWFVVPAEKRWFRNLLITEALVRTLKDLKLQYPKPTFDPASIVLK